MESAASLHPVLVVDDEPNIRESLKKVLEKEGFRVFVGANAREAQKILRQREIALVVSDLVMPETSGLEFLKQVKKSYPDIEVLLITGHATVEKAVEAMQEGAYDFITKPFKRADIIRRIQRALEKRTLSQENRLLRQQLAKGDDFRSTLVGNHPQIQEVLKIIERVAPTQSTVLITGESGTGKEIVARMLHARSRRATRPFVAVNCGAIAESVIESELFGHLKGAFTGAVADKAGLFKTASGGTLLLDEVCTLPPAVQVKLLRTLEEREIRPVGSVQPIPIDVRVIAACNSDVLALVEKGQFREDLYYRLNVVSIHLAPLRERRDDIPLLADHFIRYFNQELNKNIRGISPETLAVLFKHEWKGNVRELKNAVEHAMILCDGDTILPEHLPLRYVAPPLSAAPLELKESTLLFEKEHIRKTLQMVDGDKKEAARLLGLSLSSLYRKISELSLE